MAIAALVLGIIPFAGIGAIVAIVLGAVSLKQINASGGAQQGRGFAIAGIVLGSLWIAFFVVIIIVAIANSNTTTGALMGLL